MNSFGIPMIFHFANKVSERGIKAWGQKNDETHARYSSRVIRKGIEYLIT
jgi:hypothetical protein